MPEHPKPAALRRSFALRLAALLLILMLSVAAAGENNDWSQWGGPRRNFVVEGTHLADSWPEGGPRRLWSRPLGDGHSSILYRDGRLYTMYRPKVEGLGEGEWGTTEAIIALDANSGETLWEHRYEAEALNFRFGSGPHSTPLLVGNRLFAAGTNKQIFALDTKDGHVLWQHDLVADYQAPPTLLRPAVKAGYGSSAIAYGDTVIFAVGGPGQSLMAFNQKDGSVVWKSGDFNIAHSAPLLIDIDGEEQLVFFGGLGVYGLDPRSGTILWNHPHDTRGDMNNSTPIWDDGDNTLIVSSAYDVGSRAIKLEIEDGKTTAKELWFSSRLQDLFGTLIRLDDFVVGVSGDFGPSFFTALKVSSGELLWQARGYPRASIVRAGDKLLVLDEDGELALVRASQDGLEVLSTTHLFDTTSWTVPTLVGRTLYARDRAEITALDLGGDG